MKKILLLMLCLLLACPAVMAEEEKLTDKSGQIEYYIREDGTAFITDYDTDASTVRIPETITTEDGEKITVTGIDSLYFHGTESISIPFSLTTIEQGLTNSSLREIYVAPDHPVFATIDGVLFEKPTRTLICYPSGFTAEEYTVPDGIKVIGASAFYNNTYLTTVKLPESLVSIGDGGFRWCYSLTNIILPNSLTSIDNYAFYCCPSLADVVLPNSLSSIGSSAFAGTNVERIFIPSSVIQIDEGAFQYSPEYYGYFEVDHYSPATTLVVEHDSYAAQYAMENNYRYEYIDGEEDLSWLTDDTTEQPIETEEVIEDTSWLKDEE